VGAWQPAPANIGWRIDYVLASEAVATKAKSAAAYREVGTSDHAPVVVEMQEPGLIT
jgi:exodeoxyribonuclease-3